MADPTFRDRATLLLSNLEEGREVRTYLHQFSRAEGGCFAVIKIGGALIESAADVLGERLSLLQALGLKPFVVYGAGPQLNTRLVEAGIGEERIDGLRITPKAAIPIIADEINLAGLKLLKALERAGGHGSMVSPALIRATRLDTERYGEVGDAVSASAGGIEALVSGVSIPLIGCLGQDVSGDLLNINADDIARLLAQSLEPQKIVFLSGPGGLLNDQGQVIDTINLETDLDRLLTADWVAGGMELKLRMIASLLERLPRSSSVSITSPDQLMKELFTHGGAGTLIRRGEAILSTTNVDEQRLTPLLEDAFGSSLAPGYWNQTKIDRVIHTEQFRAAALLAEEEGYTYLDKFAVSPSARGEGLAKTLWREISDSTDALVWRSRKANAFNAFYHAVCDASVKLGDWHIFACGQNALSLLQQAAPALSSAPPDFE